VATDGEGGAGVILNIITACSRPENLPRIATALAHPAPFEVKWWVSVDAGVDRGETPAIKPWPGEWPRGLTLALWLSTHRGTWGGAQRNDCLDQIEDRSEWVWHLDDDNLPHPRFWEVASQAIADHPKATGLIFHQQRFDGWPPGPTGILPNDQSQGVDTAQFLFRRSAIGNIRWRTDRYDHDRLFFEAVAAANPGQIVRIDEVCTYHNALRKS
jgi:hypothetical protein